MSNQFQIEIPENRESSHWIDLVENLSGGKPLQQTRVQLWKSTKGLHIFFEVTDNYVIASKTIHDSPLWEEEVVEVLLDPVGDLHAYFEIEVNPIGTVTDLVLRKNRSGWRQEFGWHCEGLDRIVHRKPSGWDCEMMIPFGAIVDHPPRKGDVWRANFFRIDRPIGRSRELSAWSPTYAGTFHIPSQFGSLLF